MVETEGDNGGGLGGGWKRGPEGAVERVTGEASECDRKRGSCGNEADSGEGGLNRGIEVGGDKGKEADDAGFVSEATKEGESMVFGKGKQIQERRGQRKKGGTAPDFSLVF